jgi:soluble lytic murein transglycosylase-like protein/TolA-binding protein
MMVFSAITVLFLMTASSAVFAQDAFEALLKKGLAYIETNDPSSAVALLSRASMIAPSKREKAKGVLLLIRAFNDLAQPEKAGETANDPALAEIPPCLQDLLEFEKLRALFLTKSKNAKTMAMDFLARNPQSSRAQEARLLLASLLDAQSDPELAKVAQEVIANAKDDEDRAMGLFFLGRSSGEEERRKTNKRIFVSYPHTRAGQMVGLSEDQLTEEEMWRRADAFNHAFMFEEEMAILEKLWQKGKRDTRVALRLAFSHLDLVRDDPKRAIELLDVAKGAMSEPERLYAEARAYGKIEDYESAWQLYKKYLEIAPKGRWRERALYYLGWLPYDKGDYEKALPYLDLYLKKMRRGSLRSYIVWAKGWALFKLGRYKEALAIFDRMRKMGNPLVAGKAMYWGGVAFLRMGDKENAKKYWEECTKTYPLTYYAYLSARKLEQVFNIKTYGWVKGLSSGGMQAKTFWGLERLPKALAKTLQEVKDLSEVGEIEKARKVYGKIRGQVEKRFKGKDKALFLLTVNDAIRDYHALFERATKEFSRYLGRVPNKENAVFWALWYPRAYKSHCEVLSQRFGIPEFWVYSIMRQESRYRPHQISYTAALGVLQMIPKTAKIVSKALGVPFVVQRFFNEGQNLLFGTYYLSALNKDFKKQIVFASAGYNAGAPPIKRFMQRHKGLPFDEMVEHISYNEARNYCRMVASHILHYIAIYGAQGDPSALISSVFPPDADYELGSEVDY